MLQVGWANLKGKLINVFEMMGLLDPAEPKPGSFKEMKEKVLQSKRSDLFYILENIDKLLKGGDFVYDPMTMDKSMESKYKDSTLTKGELFDDIVDEVKLRLSLPTQSTPERRKKFYSLAMLKKKKLKRRSKKLFSRKKKRKSKRKKKRRTRHKKMKNK